MHFEDYPKLTENRKKYLLERSFSKGKYSIKIDEIAAYLDDKDISLKAIKLPTERFNKILYVYKMAWRHKTKKYSEAQLRIKDDKTFTSQFLIAASHSWALEMLGWAIFDHVPPPQKTKDINNMNRAKKELHAAQLKIGIEDDPPIEAITFEAYMKKNRSSLLPYLKEQWKVDSQNSSVSTDRETRIYPEAMKFVKEIYFDMYTSGLDGYQMFDRIHDESIKTTQNIKSIHKQVIDFNKSWENAIHHMEFLEDKHKEFLQNN